MLLYFEDEIPHLCATLWILKAESIVNTVWFGPNDKCIWQNENGLALKRFLGLEAEEFKSRAHQVARKLQGRVWGMVRQLTLLALVHVVSADGC